MGLLDGLIGTASSVDTEEIQKYLDGILREDEEIEVGFKVIRDLVVFTSERLILMNKQGIKGTKIEYHSLPYKSISHFSVETVGGIDVDAELKLWVSGAADPTVSKRFKDNSSIYDIQKILATVCL